MALGTTRLEFLMTGNASGLLRELDKVGAKADKEFGRARSSADKWATGLTRGGAAAVGFAAVVGAGLFKAAKAADEAQQAQLRLENTLKNSPKLAGSSSKAFTDLAKSIMAVTVVDDDAIVSSIALLGQFGATEDQIKTLTPLVVDLSRKMGIDLDTAAKAVGKSMDGQTTGLRRMGIVVDEAKAKTDAYGATVDALAGTVGGFAQAEAKTFSGQMAQLKVSLGEVAEGIGTGVIPVFQDLLGPIKGVAKEFQDLDPAVQKSVGTFATWATVAVGAVGALSFAAGQVGKLRERLTLPTGGLNAWGKAAGITGVAALGLGTAFTLLAADAGKAEKDIDDLKEAVRETGKSLGAVTGEKLADLIADVEDAPAILRALEISVRDVNEAVTGSDESWESLSGRLKEAAQDASRHTDISRDLGMSQQEAAINIGKLRGELESQRAAFKGARDELKVSNEATDELRGSSLDATTAVEGLGGATDDLGGAAGDAAGKIDQVKRAEDRYAEAAKRTEDAIRDQTDAVLSMSDLRQDLAEANDRATEAETAWQDAVAEFGPKSAEARSALHELQDVQKQNAQNAADLKIKMLEASGATLTQERKTRILAQSFRDLAGEIGPNSPLYKYVLGLADALDDATEDRSVKITYTVTANGVRVPLFDRGLLHLAEGGPVKAREPVVVGEEGPELYVPKNLRPATKTPKDQATVVGVKGPELFVPPAAGEIIPNDRLDIRAKRATGGPVEKDRRYLVGEKGPEVYRPEPREAVKAVFPTVQARPALKAVMAPSVRREPVRQPVKRPDGLFDRTPRPPVFAVVGRREAGPSGRGSLTDRLFRPWAPSRERDAAGRDPRLAGLTGMPAALAARLTGERVPKPTPRKGSVDERFRERLEKRAVLADARRDMPSRVDVVSLGQDLARTIGRAIPQTALSGTKATKTGAPMTINITMPPGSDGYDVVQALEKYRRRNGTFPWTGAA